MNMTHWKTMDGKVIKITDMTDDHLRNAIAYSEKREKYVYADLLMEEVRRREKQLFMDAKRECPFCHATMTRIKVESDPNEGVGWGWIKYSFWCNACGARGPLEDYKSKS